jgi:hypothetical protein
VLGGEPPKQIHRSHQAFHSFLLRLMREVPHVHVAFACDERAGAYGANAAACRATRYIADESNLAGRIQRGKYAGSAHAAAAQILRCSFCKFRRLMWEMVAAIR